MSKQQCALVVLAFALLVPLGVHTQERRGPNGNEVGRQPARGLSSSIENPRRWIEETARQSRRAPRQVTRRSKDNASSRQQRHGLDQRDAFRVHLPPKPLQLLLEIGFGEKFIDEIGGLWSQLVPSILFFLIVLGWRQLFRKDAVLISRSNGPWLSLRLYFFLASLVILTGLYLPGLRRILHLLSVFVLVLGVIQTLSMAVVDGFLERARGVAIPVIVRDVTVIVLYLIVSIIVLSNFGVDLTGILTGSVVLTAVVGLAMQDTLGSIASGLALQIERPFQENDWILFDGVTGRVLEINWRTTKLWTHADEIIHIPNKELTSQRLTNLSQPDVHHRRQITLGLPYDIPPNQCKELLEAAAQTEGVLNTPPPFATLSEFGESSIRYTLSFYLTNIRTYLQIEDRVLTNIWYRLHRSGIEIPYPTRTITTYEGGTKALPHSAFDSTAARERVLQSVPFLSLLPEEERTDLAKRITLQTYGARETVIQQGQEGDSLFIIRDGEVEVLVDTPSLQQPRRVAMLGAGEFFGEMSLLTGERRSATIRTLSDANFYLIEHEVFADVLAKHRDLHEQIAAVLEERLKNLKNQSSLNSGAVEPTADPQDDETVLSRIRIFFGL